MAKRPDQLNARFDSLVADIESADLPIEALLTVTGRCRYKLDALDARKLAAHDASRRKKETLSGRGGNKTKKQAKKEAARADAVKENPDLGDDLANGDLGTEKLDAIARASDKTNGVAANDEKLIEDIKNGSADDANKIAQDYIDKQTTDEEHDTRHKKQRARRRVRRFTTKRDTEAIMVEGDEESIDEIWTVLGRTADKMYRKDGGRDVPAGKHARTRDQRMFDAAHHTITNHDKTSSTGGPAVDATVFVTMTVDDLAAGDMKATRIGGGTVPPATLEKYLCKAAFIGVVFDGDGQVLWHGRKKRFATEAQHSALIARDHGCVLCHDGPDACIAHHIIPWTAPAKGETNIEDLALQCEDCHTWLHENNLTLYQDEAGTWRTRPATATETPRDGPKRTSKQRQSEPANNGDKPTFTLRCEVGRSP